MPRRKKDRKIPADQKTTSAYTLPDQEGTLVNHLSGKNKDPQKPRAGHPPPAPTTHTHTHYSLSF